MDNTQVKLAARLISIHLIQKGALEMDLDEFAVKREITGKEVVAIHRAIRELCDEMTGNSLRFNSIPEIIAFAKADPDAPTR